MSVKPSQPRHAGPCFGLPRLDGPWVVALLPGVLAAAACGGDPGAPPRAPETPQAQRSAPELPKGSLARSEVVQAVDAGLGAFLQRIKVEPSLEGARFSGFRVVELVPKSFWQDVDLQEGDVVTHVNGKSIEDPAVAFEVFESLRTADALEVLLVRGGARKQLRYPIVGAPQPRPANSADQGS